MRRAAIIAVVLAVVIGGALVTYRITAQAKEPPAPDYETVSVARGDLISTVSATGTIEPEAEVALLFRTPGRVEEVAVAKGQEVEAGDLVARLDTDDLTLSLAQAQNGLAIAQAQLAKLVAGATQTELDAAEASVQSAAAGVDSAQAALASARSAYNDLQAGPSADELQAAKANLERARIVLEQAQAAYDRVAGDPNIGMLPQSMQLQQATVDYEAAAANYRVATAAAKDSQLAAAAAQIAQAEAAVAQAQAGLASAQSNLERLQEGAKPEDLAVAEAQVTQAQLGVQQAQLALENVELRAPIAGVVSQLNIKPGEIATQAAPAAVITDLSRFHINVDVDEIDIGKLTEGQQVDIILDSAPESLIKGHVDFIAPTPASLGSVVSYEVIIVIDESDRPLRSGLSATASIITEELNDVVIIPNRAIQIDRTSGRAYVEKVVNGVPARTEIQMGSRNEQQSQVLSGVGAGDVLAIRSAGALDRFSGGFFGQ